MNTTHSPSISHGYHGLEYAGYCNHDDNNGTNVYESYSDHASATMATHSKTTTQTARMELARNGNPKETKTTGNTGTRSLHKRLMEGDTRRGRQMERKTGY